MLKKPEIKFLEDHNLTNITFPLNKDTLLTAEVITEKTNLADKRLIEKILNLPADRQEEIVWQLRHKPGIDLELAAGKNLNNAQFREHLDIAHYNYALEYGSLKDTGGHPITKALISNPDFTADQLYKIKQSCYAEVTRSGTLQNPALEKPDFSTNSKVLEYFAKINPEIVEEFKIQGYAECLGEPGYVPKKLNLAYEDPQYLTEILSKATGHTMENLSQESQNTQENSPGRKI